MNDPLLTVASGASHQNRELKKTLLTPRHCSTKPDACGLAGASGTMRKIAAAAAKVESARTTKTPRHVNTERAAASGAVASNAPTPPATIIQPASDACLSGEYHSAIAFNGAIRQTATPAPMSTRANARPDRPSLTAKRSAPHPATQRSTGSTRLGP